jgi:hypothetical protein
VSDPDDSSCPSCGHVNSADATFCTDCGAILPPRKGSRPPPPPDEPSPWQRAEEEPSPGRSRGRRGVVLAAATLILVAIGAWIAIDHYRGSALIPVPGAGLSRATETAAPSPTIAPPATPTAPPPTVAPRRERGNAPERPPHTPAPHAAGAEPRPGNPAPGWYRVRYRAPLFRDPNETSPVIAYLPAGTKVRVTRIVPGFLAVESVTGKPPGYLSSDDASPESEP